MAITLEDSVASVTFSMVNRVDFSTVRNVKTVIFGDGTDIQVDYGKENDYIIIGGTENTNPETKVENFNIMVNRGEDITLTGMNDSNLDTDYKVVSFDYKRTYKNINVYNFSITLERLHGRLE